MFITTPMLWSFSIFLIMSFISVGVFIHKRTINKRENEIIELKAGIKEVNIETKEIRDNYINRFEDLKDVIVKTENNLRESNHKMRTEVSQYIMTVDLVLGLMKEIKQEFKQLRKLPNAND